VIGGSEEGSAFRFRWSGGTKKAGGPVAQANSGGLLRGLRSGLAASEGVQVRSEEVGRGVAGGGVFFKAASEDGIKPGRD